MKNVSNARPSIIDANQNFRAGNKSFVSESKKVTSVTDNFAQAFLPDAVIDRLKGIVSKSEPETTIEITDTAGDKTLKISNQVTQISKKSINVTTPCFSSVKTENPSFLVLENRNRPSARLKNELMSVKTEKQNGNNSKYVAKHKNEAIEQPQIINAEEYQDEFLTLMIRERQAGQKKQSAIVECA
ncbi:MAG: hypothetical protein Q4Q53_06995 [Methanocorpusculum sp.]|nr:hypothetical protein [Methanocorpusculum sp.]